MVQAKFSICESHIEFLKNHSQFGFKDKSAMVRLALEELKRKLDLNELIVSAELYSEIYKSDKELIDLTETALSNWPEE
ncbi:MAG TPA: hypothetical protein PLP19_06005 [bacterium]|nr:hypothetical protein [bacterium]HPN43021.1 hypothetical protein [bacterium]